MHHRDLWEGGRKGSATLNGVHCNDETSVTFGFAVAQAFEGSRWEAVDHDGNSLDMLTTNHGRMCSG